MLTATYVGPDNSWDGCVQMDSRTFLETIFGENEGYLFISTKDDQGRLTNHKPFKYPDNLTQLVGYVDARQDIDVYFSPMLYSVPRRKSSTVSSTPVIYCDTDTFPVDDFLVPPSINVRTSTDPVKHHSYWLLDDEYKPKDVEAVARAIALAHAKKINGVQAGTDPSGWDLTQLLRMPNTVNTKHAPAQPVELVDSNLAVYSLAEVEETYDTTGLPVAPLPEDTELPSDLPEAIDVLRKITSDSKLTDLYSNEPRGDWSDTLYLFCSEMFRAGFTPEEVLVAAWNSKANKYKRDGRPMAHLWQYDVLKAQADPNNSPRPKTDRMAYEPEERPKDEGLAAVLETTLLKEDERVKYLTDSFVDRYVTWASSKTDAPAPYHVAGAFTIVSCVLGEWGVAQPQFGDLRLGMFFVIMGETTRTRKSTARNKMKQLLRFVQSGDYEYILSGDVTPETLLDALAERPHQSSLYDRDEFQNLINDVKHKPYMAGFFETLNEMYDGWARGRMRKDKRTKDTPVNFVQYAMGIRSQIQENLELSDFVSGYLPRNIFVRGEAPPRVRGEGRLRQRNPNEATHDTEFLALSKELIDARNYWSSKASQDKSNPVPIFFEEDAWERWLDFSDDLADYIAKHHRAEILDPSVDRLSINVLKAATLFAMLGGRDKGNMSDVINAIYYGAQWVEDLIIVAEGVSESYQQRILENIELYIADKGGIVTYPALLKWATGQGILRRDLMEYIQHLIDEEAVRIVDAKGGKKSVELVNV